jgi:hypothetical protein
MRNERGTTQAEPLIQMGYPDFWPVMLQKYESFFAYANDLGPTIDEIFDQGHSEPLHKVCRHLAKMVANSLSAVVLLAVNGFGIDALKIGRTMFETAVTVAYLRKNPAEYADYADFHFVTAHRRYEYMNKYTPERLQELSPEAVKDSLDGYARVVARFTKNGRVRGHWCSKSFAKMCADLGLEENYLTLYALTSNIIHGDFSGMAAQADPEPGVLDVDISPSENFVDLALVTAHTSFVIAATEYIALARPEKEELAKKLDNDCIAVWGKKAAETT